MVRILRITRAASQHCFRVQGPGAQVFRVIRVVKVMKFIRSLRQLVESVMHTMRSEPQTVPHAYGEKLMVSAEPEVLGVVNAAFGHSAP